MKRLVLIVPILLAAACSTTQRGVEIRTDEVPVIRTEKCVKASDLPVRPSRLAPPRPKNASRALDLAVSKVLSWERYGGEADTLLKGCSN